MKLKDGCKRNKINNQFCGSGMFKPDPGSEFFYPGSRVKNKNLDFLNPETVSKLSEK
jgi:hypothetical protein